MNRYLSGKFATNWNQSTGGTLDIHAKAWHNNLKKFCTANQRTVCFIGFPTSTEIMQGISFSKYWYLFVGVR